MAGSSLTLVVQMPGALCISKTAVGIVHEMLWVINTRVLVLNQQPCRFELPGVENNVFEVLKLQSNHQTLGCPGVLAVERSVSLVERGSSRPTPG